MTIIWRFFFALVKISLTTNTVTFKSDHSVIKLLGFLYTVGCYTAFSIINSIFTVSSRNWKKITDTNHNYT